MPKIPEDQPFARGAFDDDNWEILLPKPPDPTDPADISSFWCRPEKIGRMGKEQLVRFVEEYCDGSKIFTSADVREQDQLELIFMCVALGAFSKWSEENVKEIGILYEYWHLAGPRSINGYPIFFSMHIMHVEDWKKAQKAIANELLRRKERAKGIADDL